MTINFSRYGSLSRCHGYGSGKSQLNPGFNFGADREFERELRLGAPSMDLLENQVRTSIGWSEEQQNLMKAVPSQMTRSLARNARYQAF